MSLCCRAEGFYRGFLYSDKDLEILVAGFEAEYK